MSKSTQAATIRTQIAYGAVGFGVLSVLSPKAFAAIYGIKGDGNLMTMIRLWGTRNIALGAVMLMVNDADQRTMAMIGSAMNALDAVAIAAAGSDLDTRTRMMGSATSASFAAAGLYAGSRA